jgi:transposase InsO family protein
MPEPVGQQARWLELLEEYDFEIEHRPGKKHANADALSRRPCRQCNVEDEEFDVRLCHRITLAAPVMIPSDDDNPLSNARLKEGYAQDPKLATFYNMFTTNTEQVPWGQVVGLDSTTKNLWTQWDRINNQDGVLRRKWISADGLHTRWQLIPPKSAQRHLLEKSHTGMTGGHLGIKRMQHQLQLRAYWPGWADDVARYCKQCNECAQYHRGQLKRQGELQTFPTGEPFERIAIDLTGPHPPSRSGHTYILTMVDLFSKWAEAIPIRNKEAITVARALVDVVICRFGVPLQLLSDNGKEFDNSVLKEICRLLEIDKIRTTVYKASTNGAVERLHRTMNSMIGKVVDSNQRNWDEFLPSIMAAYRASRHEATGYSPNFLMFGKETRAPVDVMFGLDELEKENHQSYDEYAEHKIEIMRKAYQFAREHLGTSAERSKRNYDMRVRPNRYEVGQWVFYYCPRRFPRRSPKWQRMFTGPFLITQVLGPVNVRIQGSKRSQPFVVHIDKLKRCLGTTPDSWLVNGNEVAPEVPVSQPFAVENSAPEDEMDITEPPAEPDDDPSTEVNMEATKPKTMVNDEISQPPENELSPKEQRPRRMVRRPQYLNDYEH